jgi:hypothetical protein
MSALSLNRSDPCPQNLRKEIPGTPEGQAPVHEKKNPIYGNFQ